MATTTFSAVISLLLLSMSVSSLPSVNGNIDCGTVIANLVGCVPYLSIGSPLEKPEPRCCSGLKIVLDTDAACLCDVLKNGGASGIHINVTKATTLPVECNLHAPPASACNSPLPPSAPGTPAPGPGGASNPGSASAPAPGPSSASSLIPISSLSFVIGGVLIILFSLI